MNRKAKREETERISKQEKERAERVMFTRTSFLFRLLGNGGGWARTREEREKVAGGRWRSQIAFVRESALYA